MKNKALNGKDRERLAQFAKDNVKCPELETEFNTLYEDARLIVLAAVHAKFPPADMEVLRKYGCTQTDKCIRFGGYYDNESQFKFRADDNLAPLVPSSGGCSSREYDWDAKSRDVLNRYVLARQALENGLQRKLRDYKALITGSRTFNDVVAVWPAVEKLRHQIIPETPAQRALAVLSQEAVQRISADNAGGK